MASEVAIANRALTKLGEERILSFGDETKQARAVSSLWDTVRDSELRSRNWNFATKRTQLAALNSTPSWGYTYEYQLPADCLRVVQVNDYWPTVSLTDYRTTSESEYQIEGQKILTDLAAPLKVRYLARIKNTGLWDAAFNETFACRLAVELAETLTQSSSKRELAWQEYQRSLVLATRTDAIENPPEAIADDAWMLGRL